MLANLAYSAALLLAQDPTPSQPIPSELQGIWRYEDTELRVQAQRLALSRNGELSFHLVTAADSDGYTVWSKRGPATWQLERKELELHVRRGDEEFFATPADTPSDTVDPQRIAGGDRTQIDSARIRKVASELRRRSKRDRDVRQPLTAFGVSESSLTDEQRVAIRDVDTENAARLTELVTELGWIDAETFGEEACAAALRIAQHSGDPALGLTAVAWLGEQQDSEEADPQQYTAFYDRLQIRLGLPQRYGTQVVGGADGELWLYPLEDPEAVEERRREAGLYPLATYLNILEAHTKKTIRR